MCDLKLPSVEGPLSSDDILSMMEIGGEAGTAGARDGHPPSLNISDVIEAISVADPAYGAAGGVAAGMPRAPPAQGALASPSQPAGPGPAPAVRILEQPASKALRFRYECEGRSAGSIPGVHSTSEKKTYPTIQIQGYRGNAIVVVSCVNKDPENRKYRPHPHNLVGRERCKNGVCTVEVSGEEPVVTFSNLGIQCVKRRDIAEALRLREEIRVDPFKTGFGHKSQPQSIELNAVRLCFQVFLRDRAGKITAALPPAVSEVIYDKKAMSELNIARVSHCAGPATGGTELILLCEKVNREDIAVVFFETAPDGGVVWEETANVLLVYKQVAIVAHSPPYRDPATCDHHKVQIQLKRLVDDTRSPPCSFMYTPNYTDPNIFLPGKKRKTISPYVETLYETDRSFSVDNKDIKLEPKSDRTPPHGVSSPPQSFPAFAGPQDMDYQRWVIQIENMKRGLPPDAAPAAAAAGGDLAWRGDYSPVSPALHPLSPGVRVLSPDAPALSPHMMSPSYSAMSPEIHMLSSGMKMTNLSPNLHTLTPMGQTMPVQGGLSPNPAMGHVSPGLGHVSPGLGHLSPGMGHVSPHLGHVSPNLGHVSPNLVDGVQRQDMTQHQVMAMDTSNNDTPSFSGLLNSIDRGDIAQLNSGELSGLVSMLQDNAGDLSDSLIKLPTRDLLHHDLS